MLVLLLIVAVGLWAASATPAGTALESHPFFGVAPWAALGPAMVGALFSADAWNNITFTAGEVRRPQRNLPLSLLLGTGATVALYLLVNVAYLAVLSLPELAHAPADRVAAAMAQKALGGNTAALVSGCILVSTFGCVNGLVLAGAREPMPWQATASSFVGLDV